MRLKESISVVTGGGSGIGKGIALEFGIQGSTVIVIDRDRESGLRTAEEIVQNGGQSFFIQGDISSSSEVGEIFKRVEQEHNRLDILVNSAGVTGRSLGDGPVSECSEAAWDLIMDINLKGTFLCCKQGLNLMSAQQKGTIINLSSVLGLVGCQDYFKSHAYQTSKAGIIGLTRSLAAYYAKYGIRANVIAPGLIETAATVKVKEDEEVLRFAERMQPLGALGQPEDVAKAAVYLASEESSFVTGQVLSIDGGWTAQ